MLGEEERSEEEGSFSKASIPKRIAIVAAGGLVNIVFGLFLYFILAISAGNYISTTIDTVTPGLAAAEAGINQNDTIIKMNGRKVRLRSDINEKIQNSKGESLIITIKREGKIKDIEVIPTIENDRSVIGVTFKLSEKNLRNNLYYGFWDTVDFSKSILINLKEMLSGKVSVEQLTGPVGISEAVSKTQGIIEFIYMLSLISLSLGITNLLPFPPLDGGKIIFLLIEWVRRRPIREKTEVAIQMAGFCLLIGLSIYVTYNDIIKIF